MNIKVPHTALSQGSPPATHAGPLPKQERDPSTALSDPRHQKRLSCALRLIAKPKSKRVKPCEFALHANTQNPATSNNTNREIILVA